MLKHLLLSTAGLALAVPAMAQGAAPLDETVVVSATRIPTTVSQVASSVTVITAPQIEARQLRDLPSVLRTVPGLDVVQSGGPGGQTSLFMRGSNSNHTKVILDGIDIGDPSNPTGAADVSKLLTGDIARLEVLRGPGSALYGSDAIGGVISITTKDGAGPLTLTGMAEEGSFDTNNQSLNVSGSDGAFHYSATAQHDHAGAVAVTPLALLPPGQKRNDDYYDNVAASTKLGYDITSDFSLGVVGHYNNSLGKITNDAFNFVTFQSYPSPSRSRIETLQYDGRATAHLSLWDGRFDQTLGLGFNSSAISNADPDNGTSLVSGSRTKLDWQGTIKLADGQTLVLGAESARDAIHLPLSAGITTNAGYGEYQASFGAFAGSAGIRYDDNSRYGSKLTWHVAPVYTIAATGTKLKATAGSGFKAPSLQQLFGPFGHNPDLRPETGIGYDAGIEQGLAATVSAGVTWFHNDIRNLVDYDAAFKPVNIGKARTQGVESFLAWQVSPALGLRADYTYTEAENMATRAWLLRRPHHKASLEASWQASAALNLEATLLYVGPGADIGRESFLLLKDPAFTTLNLAASYRLKDAITLFGRVENLTDQTYEDPNGFQRPGIGAYAGIKASF